jgi:hypothetical protein
VVDELGCVGDDCVTRAEGPVSSPRPQAATIRPHVIPSGGRRRTDFRRAICDKAQTWRRRAEWAVTGADIAPDCWFAECARVAPCTCWRPVQKIVSLLGQPTSAVLLVEMPL